MAAAGCAAAFKRNVGAPQQRTRGRVRPDFGWAFANAGPKSLLACLPKADQAKLEGRPE
jgi:hypothetical protein